MKIINWWPHITKYFFWGFLLTILPLYTDFVLKRYENRSAFNQLILTQGLQPYRTKQIECNRKSFTTMISMSKELENWKLIKAVIQSTNPISYNNSIFIEKDKGDEIKFFMDNTYKISKQIIQEQKELEYCQDESICFGDNLAMLLDLSSEYQKLFDELQMKLKNIAKKQQNLSLAFFARFNLTTSDNLPDWNKFNELMVNADNFFQGKVLKIQRFFRC